MTIGFVLIITHPGMEHTVYSDLSEIDEVAEVHPLFGEYDIIAKVIPGKNEDLGMVVVDKIRTISGISDTKTLSGIRF